MKLLKGQKEIKVYKTQRPKFSQRSCWSDSVILINGKEVDIFWECMRGQIFSFNMKINGIKFHFSQENFRFLKLI